MNEIQNKETYQSLDNLYANVSEILANQKRDTLRPEKKIVYILIGLTMLIVGCSQNDKKTQIGLDSATIENMQDKMAEHTSVVSRHPILDQLYAELDSADVYNDSIIYGYWFKGHEALHINLFLHKDNTYEFKYYEVDDSDKIIHWHKKGTFSFNGKIIKLSSDDGWNEFCNGTLYYKHNGTNYYIANKNEYLYLVKGSD